MRIGQKFLLGLVGILSLSLFSMMSFPQYSHAEGVKNKVCEELEGAKDVDESVLQAAGCSGPTGYIRACKHNYKCCDVASWNYLCGGIDSSWTEIYCGRW